jgi:hypothetical protein
MQIGNHFSRCSEKIWACKNARQEETALGGTFRLDFAGNESE